MLALRPALFAVCHDEEYARVSGLPVRALNLLLAVTTAVTVTIAMRAVGLLLVSALMVVPVATAQQVTRGFRSTMTRGHGARACRRRRRGLAGRPRPTPRPAPRSCCWRSRPSSWWRWPPPAGGCCAAAAHRGRRRARRNRTRSCSGDAEPASRHWYWLPLRGDRAPATTLRGRGRAAPCAVRADPAWPSSPSSASGERCVHELVEKLGAPQPLVSQHLRVLRGAGVVRGLAARSGDRVRAGRRARRAHRRRRGQPRRGGAVVPR